MQVHWPHGFPHRWQFRDEGGTDDLDAQIMQVMIIINPAREGTRLHGVRTWCTTRYLAGLRHR